MHEGHRQRMLERIANGDALCDHELLELLLYNAIPRKNTNELAHALLEKYGSLAGVLSAGQDELKGVAGVGAGTAAYLRAVALVCGRVNEREEEIPPFANVELFTQYLVRKLRPLEEEFLEVYCLDGLLRVSSVARFTSHDSASAKIASRELGQLLVSRAPKYLLLAHNHPRGGSAPSVQDDKFTARAQVICSSANVRLVDHIIVGAEDTYSYFYTGRLEEIREKFDLNALIAEWIDS